MKKHGCIGVVLFLIAGASWAADSSDKKPKSYEAANSVQDVVAPFVKSVTKTYDESVVKDLPAHEREPASEDGPSKDEVIHGK